MKTLIIDCCIREDLSGTREFYQEFIKRFRDNNEIEIIYLTKENFKIADLNYIEKRQNLLDKGILDDEMFKYAHQFKNADEIIVAAPYWDLSFPSLLKVYLEQVSVAGITFGYENSPIPTGYCKAKSAIYFSTAGGYIQTANLGFEYVKALFSMFGIKNIKEYTIKELDIELSKREELIHAGMEKIFKTIKN